jgi:hypothetical protein
MFSFIYKIYGEKNKTINVKGVVPGIWKWKERVGRKDKKG